MALGSAGYTGTGGTLDKYVPEVWTKRAQLAFDTNMIAKNFCTDLSEMLSYQGGDVLHIPKLANRASASTRSLTALSQVTPLGPTEGEFTMNVQTWRVDSEAISDAVPVQTKLFTLANLEKKMNQSVMRAFDTDIYGLNSSLTTTAQGTDNGATAPSADDFFSALETLDTNKIPKEERAIIVGPKTFWDLVRGNVITNRDFVGDAELAKKSGMLPTLGGVPVYMSQNIPDSASGSELNLVLHKEAFAFALARDIQVRSSFQLDWLQTVYIADMLYGVGCYRTDAGVVVYGR